MSSREEHWLGVGWCCLLAAAGLMVTFGSPWGPLSVGILLASLGGPWRVAWRGAEGTALRGALVWAAAALVLGITAQLAAAQELRLGGGVWTGRITYMMVLATMAGLVSVLGARQPGGGAWAILMVLLVVVFLIPWLEAGGRIHRVQGISELQLQSPWTLFYGLLVVAGVTNYLPTRFGLAAGVLGLGLFLEYLGLTRPEWGPAVRLRVWVGVSWTLALSGRLAAWARERGLPAAGELDRVWIWFRDHWGAVWALRIQERFNRSAELARWPVRLTWFGLGPGPSSAPDSLVETPGPAAATLRNLIRRFASPSRIDALLARDQAQACHPEEPGR